MCDRFKLYILSLILQGIQFQDKMDMVGDENCPLHAYRGIISERHSFSQLRLFKIIMRHSYRFIGIISKIKDL